LFEDRFVATTNFGVRLGAIKFKSLSLEDSLSLISNFFEEEIQEVVWQCVKDQRALEQMVLILTSSRRFGIFLKMTL